MVAAMATPAIQPWVGVGMCIFGLGTLARAYMVSRNARDARSVVPGRRVTEVRYWRLVKAGVAPKWPLYMGLTFVPIGILFTLGAFFLTNSSSK